MNVLAFVSPSNRNLSLLAITSPAVTRREHPVATMGRRPAPARAVRRARAIGP